MSDWSTISAAIFTAFPWAALLTLIGVMVRARIPMRKMTLDSETSLRADLLKQLNDQETQHRVELGRYETRIAALEQRLEDQRASYESKLEYERVTHAGEMASFRHKVNNLEASLNMLLILIETNPERASEAARKTRELREKQEIAEASEKVTITAARITASSPNAGN